MKLIDRLNGCGYEGKQWQFDELLQDAMAVFCPSLTDERLLCQPREAMRFCDLIRHRAGAPSLPDDLILWALLAKRKRESGEPETDAA